MKKIKTKIINKSDIMKVIHMRGPVGWLLATLAMALFGFNKVNKANDRCKQYQGPEFSAHILGDIGINYDLNGDGKVSTADIQVIIKRLRDAGLGILITDHNVRETLSVVDRAYVIYSGEVLCEGTRDFLDNDPQAREKYLGKEFTM